MSSLNDFFIHSMVHPDVAAAYLEGKPVPQALLINEVPETSAAPVVAEIISSANNGEWIIFKISNTNVPDASDIPTRLHDPSEPSQPSISEFIVFGRILSSYSGWTMIYTAEHLPYMDPTSIVNSGKKSGQKHETINSDPDPDPSEFPLDIHDLLFVRSGDLKQSSKEIPVYFYTIDAPISDFPTDPINNDPSVLKSHPNSNTIIPDMTEFWNQFNPEYLGEIGIADILKSPTITIRNIEIDTYREGVIAEVDIYDPDWVFMTMDSNPSFVISMSDPDTSGNIITGMGYADPTNSLNIQDIIETHTINSTFDILFRDIYWNYDNESATHEYWPADMATMSYKVVWGNGLDGYIIESNVMNFTYEMPRFGVEAFYDGENNLNLDAYVFPHKFGIENAENIPDDIELTLQYQEKDTEEWIDMENTGEWNYYVTDPEFQGGWDGWDYHITTDISSILVGMEDGESKLYNLCGVITINGQTEESESEFVITKEVREDN